MRLSNHHKIYIFLLSLIILAILEYSAISYLHQKLTSDYRTEISRKAFTLMGKIEKAVLKELKTVDLTALHQYNRNSLRQTLRNISEVHTEIHDILLIDDNFRIATSTTTQNEDLVYKKPEELIHLVLREKRIVERTSDEEREELDVVWPIYIGDDYRGHIRAIIVNEGIASFNSRRTVILFALGIGFAMVFLLLTWLILRPRIRQSKPDQSPAPQAANPHHRETMPHGGEASTEDSLFSRLSRLYDKSIDLDKSFKKSEEEIHSMMRVLNHGVLILDLNMKMISYNEYLLNLFNIRTTATVQGKVYNVFQNNPRLLEMYRRARDPLTHEVKQNLPLHILGGRMVNAEVSAKPFYYENKLAGVTFYIKNIEVLEELEHTFQRSMKYGIISQLASSIGHEIRNPLSSLAIHTEIVDNMVSKSIEDQAQLKKIRKSLGILDSEVERLQKLINQFFTLAKAQQIQLTFENINDLMKEVLDLVHQQALETNVKVSKSFSKNLPMVKVSKDQLKQVIINLILNGFDAMSGGGELTIRTYFHEGYVAISIKDTGHGIPENVRDNIFDLYFTTKDSGGGIGLAISKKIIEAHEGKLYFETKAGAGTVFYVELPTSQN